jgi:hypothetical protein
MVELLVQCNLETFEVQYVEKPIDLPLGHNYLVPNLLERQDLAFTFKRIKFSIPFYLVLLCRSRAALDARREGYF